MERTTKTIQSKADMLFAQDNMGYGSPGTNESLQEISP